jgi:pSer/pThr/pTyr-binding forkhead associated (FHA) protein
MSIGLALFTSFVRVRRGVPPAPVLDTDIPEGIDLIVSVDDAITTRRLGRRVLVGRAPTADIKVSDPRASRLHARIEVREDGVYVEDLGSRNGTQVNGEALDGSRRLAPNDEITIGNAAIIFRGTGARR